MGITSSYSWLNCALSGLGLPIGNGGCRLFGYLRITGEWGILPAKLACMRYQVGRGNKRLVFVNVKISLMLREQLDSRVRGNDEWRLLVLLGALSFGGY